MGAAKGPLYITHFRRRREGTTNYPQRLALLKRGGARLVVRKTNRGVIAQFVTFDLKGDRTLSSCTTLQLHELGFPGKRNTPSAYLVGLKAGMLVKSKGVTDFTLDIGRSSATKGSLVFAALQGALDAGLTAPHGEQIMPSADRVSGKHLSAEVQKAFTTAKQKIISEVGPEKPAKGGA